MNFAPKLIGKKELDTETLAQDKKTCYRIGPCGLGKKAIYLNSFFIDLHYYVQYSEVSRVFKRLAMSKGGFTGKGVFGSIPYLVVLMKDGTEKACNFKYEDLVDTFLVELGKEHPEIKLMSADAERKLREAEEAEKARYVKELTPEASKTWNELKEAQEYLKARPALYTTLSAAAKQKRTVDGMKKSYQIFAMVILGLAIAALIFGVYALIKGLGGAIYFVLFGIAFMFFVISTRVLPLGRNNRKAAQKEWDDALAKMTAYVQKNASFPLPPQYAHPLTLERMIRVIREGRAQTKDEAFEVMKKDLKALNSSVTVSQKEYDEVVAVKPMFLLCNYE